MQLLLGKLKPWSSWLEQCKKYGNLRRGRKRDKRQWNIKLILTHYNVQIL